MQVFITDISTIIKPEDFILQNADKLSPPDKARLSKITSKKRRLEFLAGRLMLQTYFKGHFTTTDNGKLVATSCFLSLSHSDKFIVLAISEKPVGIDIEKISDTRAWQKIAQRKHFENCKTLKDFYLSWTAYEADFKLGKTPALPFHAFTEHEGFLICLSTTTPETIELIFTPS